MRGKCYELLYASEYIGTTLIKQKIKEIQRKIIEKKHITSGISFGSYIKISLDNKRSTPQKGKQVT